jgi:putative pyruvate formate lyase activating enzyme
VSDALGATSFSPAYLALLASGELGCRAERGREYLKNCVLCGRHCKVDRLKTVRGSICRIGELARVASYGPHHGEENPLRGERGSGTIFISSCNLLCVFCQNADISQKGVGREVSSEELAAMMLELQSQGCHNINFVSPSHVVAQILAALLIAASNGLNLPLVYNTGGYDSPEALALLDGVIDIYMPDMKYGDSLTAHQYSHVRRYVEVNCAAVKEMHRQVGDLVLDERGVAVRGLLVRHLVLPGGLSDTGRVLKFIAEEISTDTYINLMDQYHPCYRAFDYPPLDRPLEDAEYRRALALASKHGLRRLDNRPSRFC